MPADVSFLSVDGLSKLPCLGRFRLEFDGCINGHNYNGSPHPQYLANDALYRQESLAQVETEETQELAH